MEFSKLTDAANNDNRENNHSRGGCFGILAWGQTCGSNMERELIES